MYSCLSGIILSSLLILWLSMLLNPDSLDPDKHEVGKQNTQKTERKNMTIAL